MGNPYCSLALLLVTSGTLFCMVAVAPEKTAILGFLGGIVSPVKDASEYNEEGLIQPREKLSGNDIFRQDHFMNSTSPNFSHLLVTKGRKGRPDKAHDRGPRKRTVWYVEESGGTRLRVAQHSQVGSFRRCSRGGVRNAG